MKEKLLAIRADQYIGMVSLSRRTKKYLIFFHNHAVDKNHFMARQTFLIELNNTRDDVDT
jgi:hypothetical protein